jgi:hypothetical protein
MNTMSAPESTPGRDIGRYTVKNAFTGGAPKVCAASGIRMSIDLITATIGSTMNGMSTWHMPISTAVWV